MAKAMEERVSAGIVGELLLGELPLWRCGVCLVKTRDFGMPDVRLVVLGENDFIVGEFRVDEMPRREPEDYEVGIFGNHHPIDLDAVAEQVNEAIQEEHEEL